MIRSKKLLKIKNIKHGFFNKNGGKSKISGNIEYYSSVRTNKAIEDCDIAVVLIDAEKQFTNQDRDIINYMHM